MFASAADTNIDISELPRPPVRSHHNTTNWWRNSKYLEKESGDHCNRSTALKRISGRRNIPFLAPTAKKKQSKTRNKKNHFHTHPDTSVAIMADCLSLNISHFYNTERGNTEAMDYFPWTDRREKVASHQAGLADPNLEVSSSSVPAFSTRRQKRDTASRCLKLRIYDQKHAYSTSVWRREWAFWKWGSKMSSGLERQQLYQNN